MREDTVKWIQSVLVPRIILQDAFTNLVVEEYEVSPIEGMKDNWASMMFEVNLILRGNDGLKSVGILLKLMDESEKVRKQMQSEKQFANEILMYSIAVPFFKSLTYSSVMKITVENLLPKCYYTHSGVLDNSVASHEDGIIAMENLKRDDYRLGSRTFLDLQHCTLAMDKLGSFHALSYFAKEQDFQAFKSEIVNNMQETNYASEGRDVCNTVFAVSEQRVLDGLAQQLPHDDLGLVRLRDIAARNAFDVFTELVKPVEPWAVLCHGDYLRNNVLFRYVNEEPVDMKLIDFQTIRYASPAIDVSLFLCMNTSYELRAAHFNDLLRTYHSSLTRTLAALQGKQRDQLHSKYHYEEFIKDFRTHALYGYLISIEFIPWMMADEKDLADFVKLFREEQGSSKYVEKARTLGGERVTTVLVELAKDFLNYGYF